MAQESNSPENMSPEPQSPRRITDQRILEGLAAQLAARTAKLDTGSQHLGWKAGFGSPAALVSFELDGPLSGFLLAEGLVQSGDVVSCAGWVKPVAEPEIAVHLGADLADGNDRDEVKAAISGLSPAIELADMSFPPHDVSEILASNIYHRHVILGPVDLALAGGTVDGLSGVVTRASVPEVVDELEATTGRLVDVVAHLANTLASCGLSMNDGDVVICGSTVPPIMLTDVDDDVRFQFGSTAEVSVRLTY